MHKNLNSKYEKTLFTTEQVHMFASILEADNVNYEILYFIAMKHAEKEDVSILQLTENIQTERRVGIRNKKNNMYFELKTTLIDRKSAERIVDKLSSMSLIFYEYMTPYKFLYPTVRGMQILKQLDENYNREDDKNNG